MSEKAEGRTEGPSTGSGQAVETVDPVLLANALRFERAKNKVLLDEVVALEDEVVNRCMEDFDAVVSDETREFWREQLLTNRDAATAALKEMQRCRVSGGDPSTGSGQGRRPLHNRATARPVVPGAAAGGTGGTAQPSDEQAARIRNRAQDISRNERVPFSAAFRRAEKELGSK